MITEEQQFERYQQQVCEMVDHIQADTASNSHLYNRDNLELPFRAETQMRRSLGGLINDLTAAAHVLEGIPTETTQILGGYQVSPEENARQVQIMADASEYSRRVSVYAQQSFHPTGLDHQQRALSPETRAFHQEQGGNRIRELVDLPITSHEDLLERMDQIEVIRNAYLYEAPRMNDITRAQEVGARRQRMGRWR
jgi:hypothetical protein